MDAEMFDLVRRGLVFYLILVGSISIHEWSHAYAADWLGDPLPWKQGRVTLNPLAHMDFWGTFIIPCLMIFMPIFYGGSMLGMIGWGKPVMISLPNPKTRVRDDLLITAAGPMSNLLIALFAAILGGVALYMGWMEYTDVNRGLLSQVIWLNCTLFVFNLLPIPPLDGSHFLKYAIGMSEEAYMKFAQWGFLILIVLINISAFRMLLFSGVGMVNYMMKWIMLWVHSLL